ncbi:MAG TPA: F0F1 ATP synthase subunit epsilon [Peptococcaceae bacterium]|jgi:F-type H+-transporting ATPase subunit epsilon|nr:F0F1 ATP synthase subunit epsilon [Clostridia bacterium]HOB81729.1 F0F1 ATP synthase subunit epsilon [Peptococcaceae bacterium]HQD54639.1 F0F1 ATP synthase subunit epsilon [Peptococcaceae bacterium]
MAENLTLEVVTPERILLKEESYSIIVPATEGLMGLWPNHAPIITGLNPGIIKYRQNDNMRVLAIGGGFMEVSDNKVSILADSAELPEEIDVTRAAAAKERAQKRLKELPPGMDVHRAELALSRALARLEAAEYK